MRPGDQETRRDVRTSPAGHPSFWHMPVAPEVPPARAEIGPRAPPLLQGVPSEEPRVRAHVLHPQPLVRLLAGAVHMRVFWGDERKPAHTSLSAAGFRGPGPKRCIVPRSFWWRLRRTRTEF